MGDKQCYECNGSSDMEGKCDNYVADSVAGCYLKRQAEFEQSQNPEQIENHEVDNVLTQYAENV